MSKLENEIKREALEYLSNHPKVALIYDNDNRRIMGRKFGRGKYRPKGLPDVTGFLVGGRGFFIEFKSPNGKLSEEQTEILSKAQRCGIKILVAFSFEDVINWASDL